MFAAVPVSRARLRAMEKAKATAADIEALAASYEPKIAEAILKAFDDLADAIDIDELAAALATGNLTKALDILSGSPMLGLADALQDAVWAGGAVAASNVAVGGAVFHFHRLNPVLVQWMENYSFSLIREIDASTKAAVRADLIKGMQLGKGPRQQATHLKQVVGLTERQSAAVANFRKELETFHTKRGAKGWKLGGKPDRVNGAQVFKPGEGGKPKDGMTDRRLRDFRYDSQLQRAMDTGKPLTPAQVDKMTAAYARKYRKYRAETIARTEAMRALNMGVQEGWRQAVEQGKVVEELVRRFWKVAKDERTCEVCNPVPGMNKKGVPLGVPFTTPKGPVMLPPLHPDCRCHAFIRQLEPEQISQ